MSPSSVRHWLFAAACRKILRPLRHPAGASDRNFRRSGTVNYNKNTQAFARLSDFHVNPLGLPDTVVGGSDMSGGSEGAGLQPLAELLRLRLVEEPDLLGRHLPRGDFDAPFAFDVGDVGFGITMGSSVVCESGGRSHSIPPSLLARIPLDPARRAAFEAERSPRRPDTSLGPRRR